MQLTELQAKQCLAGHNGTRSVNELAKEYKYFFKFALKKTSDYNLAEDVVQDAFAKALSTEAQPRGNYKTWMCRIILTTIADEYRRRKRQPTLPIITDFPAEDDPVEEARGRELSDKISIIFVTPSIAALLDKAFRERSYAQISADYNIPCGTVSSRIHSARKQLRKELAGFI